MKQKQLPDKLEKTGESIAIRVKERRKVKKRVYLWCLYMASRVFFTDKLRQLDRSRKQQSQLQQELNMQQQSKDAYPDGN
jgi:hypothetical protein